MVRIIGIDGLEINVLKKHFDILPNFKKISCEGVLTPVKSVFPADSVPAWITIFTGLNPAEHGIIRGKDYVESVEGFQDKNRFTLQGKTFWDSLSDKNFRCLVINPFLAYPVWRINGIMESGPAFIEGTHSIFPENAESLYPGVLGGYSAVSSLSGLKADMETVFSDTEKLWEEYKFQSNKENYDLEFVTFTTLDRLQHYTWRFYDMNDPLHEDDTYFSACIPQLLKSFDDRIGIIMSAMKNDDALVIISDHGFRQRPYSLINLNEYLRKEGLLILKKEFKVKSVRRSQNLKKAMISKLSKLKLLDLIAGYLKKSAYFSKLKKSDFLIDKDSSLCYTDDMFSGKKPYVGLNFGEDIRNSANDVKEAAFKKICSVLNSGEIPTPVWIKRGEGLYSGPFQSNLPDICIEFPPENGLEFNYFGDIMETSSTHYRISGGHFGSGTFGYFGNKNKIKSPPASIIDFSSCIKSLLYENSSGK